MTDAHAIPTDLLFRQSLNFTIFACIIGYIVLKKAKPYMQTRYDEFNSHALKALKEKEKAEQTKRTIQNRLDNLKSTANESKQRAIEESRQLKEKLLLEAATAAQRIKKESELSAASILANAREDFKIQLLDQATSEAQGLLNKQISQPDKQRLQSEFVEKIQVMP